MNFCAHFGVGASFLNGNERARARVEHAGPPHRARVTADELAAWNEPQATWDMLQFGLRLGERPRQAITTTPRPMALLKRLMADPSTVITRAGTRENAYYLSPAFIDHQRPSRTLPGRATISRWASGRTVSRGG